MILASDLHFGANNSYVVQKLGAAARGDSDKLLVLAGDLTQKYRPEEFVAAERFLAELIGGGVTVVCTPGNHDYGTWRGEIWSNKEARRLYDRHIFALLKQQRSVVAHNDADLIVRRGDHVFVALRSTHAHAIKRQRIRSGQLAWATGALGALQIDPQQQLHLVTHHSLWEPPHGVRKMREFVLDRHGPQTERERLETRLLRPYGFRTVITGHLHVWQCDQRQTPKLGLNVLHLGLPTVSDRHREHTAGPAAKTAYVEWLPPLVPQRKDF